MLRRDYHPAVDTRERHLLFIGLRGSGKSTLGRALAAREGRRFLDLDVVTPAFLHCDSVAQAWSRFGEPAFRAAEVRALAAALRDDPSVIALGGGTPTAPGAAEMIDSARDRGECTVVYLRCTPAELRARLATVDEAAMRERPSLTGAPALDEIDEVFRARDALYRALATREISGVRSVEEGLAALGGWREW